jgi:hypothetical protein
MAALMNQSHSYLGGWKWWALPSLAIVLLSFVPQVHFWFVRGSQWQGSYSILQGDEPLYSAYVNALIDGRPRRTDPATGQDDHPPIQLQESLFSIQFIPPFMIAWFARAFGLSASSAFIALLGVGGLLASLSIFWLLMSVTSDKRLAAVGVLVVLCFGALAGGQGLVGLLLKPEVRFLGLPFLRRYEPSIPFPFFFVFCALIWQALTSENRRRVTAKAALAGAFFVLLIFSYFYLWTAAAAWFVCILCLWSIMRPTDGRKTIRVLIVVSLPATVALAVYIYFLSHLPPALDKAQVLTFTHQPDLLRTPEIIGAFVFVLAIVGIRRNNISFREPWLIFTASCALLPFVVFNQQIISGRSIQPYHYEILVANYAVLISLVVIVRYLQPVIHRRTAVLVVAFCLSWATIEVAVPLRVRSNLDLKNDEMVPVFLRLKELSKYDGTWEGLRQNGRTPALVFSAEYGMSRLLPTWAPQGSLIATGSASFQSLSEAIRKEWLYTHLYYRGRDTEYLLKLLSDRIDDPLLTYYAKSTIFGPERALLFLGLNSQPIRQDEIDEEVRSYGTFVDSFSREQAIKRPITYAVIPADGEFDSTNLDRWYERDAGERVGAYDLYRLKLRE